MVSRNRQNQTLGGRYLLGTRLALDEETGAYYEATDTRLDRPVTIKCLAHGESPRALKRYEREARILGALDHSVLLRVFDAVLDSEDPFLVMEPVSGVSLSELKEPLSVEVAVREALQLAGGVARAHAHGFLHRRIVPEHVLLTASQTTRLLGFGRASLGRTHGSTTSDIQAKPNGFLPPEIFVMERTDPRTDLYGLGVVLFFMLTNSEPVESSHKTHVVIGNLMSKPRLRVSSLRPGIPRGLDDFIARSLAVSPSERPQSAIEWARALSHVFTEAPSVKHSANVQPTELFADRYRIEATIGQGSHGVVMLAHDEELQRKVAIKLLTGSSTSEETSESSLRKEAQAMAQVHHPNVVQVFDAGRAHGRDYFVMENVPGPSVEQRLEEGTPAREEALSLLDQAARGLLAIHEAGLVHGDVKPSNILIGPAFRVCVTDFGLVRSRETWADPRARLGGTPAYFAPERAGAVDAEHAAAIDQYALAVLAFELLSGALPYQASSPFELLRLHQHASPPRVSEAQTPHDASLVAFDSVLQKALAKDPKDRFESIEAFRKALLAANAGTREVGSAKLLIVDGDLKAGQVASAHLREQLQVEVSRVTSGTQALDEAKRQAPDLILLDLSLSDMDGIAFASELMADFDPPPPLVVLTAQGSSDDWQILSALGVEAFLFKPFDPELLTLTVRRILARRHNQD